MSTPKKKASEAYLAKLRDPRWQKKRLEVFNRDGWACKYCGDTQSSLQVHHKAYQKGKEPWDYPMDWLITACETCHEKQPRDLQPEEMELIANLRARNIQPYDMKLLADAFRDAIWDHAPIHHISLVYLVLVENRMHDVAQKMADKMKAEFAKAEAKKSHG